MLNLESYTSGAYCMTMQFLRSICGHNFNFATLATNNIVGYMTKKAIAIALI